MSKLSFVSDAKLEKAVQHILAVKFDDRTFAKSFFSAAFGG